MCAEVLLLISCRGYARGTKVLMSLNTALELVKEGKARWA